MSNKSPWIHQLNHTRNSQKLTQDLKTDVAIVGAGIAGIATAFYLLKHTDQKVTVLEGYKLAHGATGHNAGYLASYFERPFREIVEEFGLEMACEGQRDVDSAWELLDEIYTEAGLDIPLAKFTSYAGVTTKEQLLGHLENDYLRRSGGIKTRTVEIVSDAPFLSGIPEKYHKLFTLIDREELNIKLETFDPQYQALLATKKGVMNSALFCQEVASFLFKKYPERFSLYEHSPVIKLIAHKDKVLLDVETHTVEADKVVLCTNGFENINIITDEGLGVNSRFHHNIHGVIAFMTGYLEPHTGIPAAISYFPKGVEGITDNPGEAYFYVTRRSYEYDPPLPGSRGEKRKHNLICIGGPDYELEHRSTYNRDLEFSDQARQEINKFVRHSYDKKEDLEYLFTWHGVMGYTRNLLRMVGSDPEHKNLFYNLGCNGVGLLPSIFAGEKVARQIKGEAFPPSIFDVPVVVGSKPQKTKVLAS